MAIEKVISVKIEEDSNSVDKIQKKLEDFKDTLQDIQAKRKIGLDVDDSAISKVRDLSKDLSSNYSSIQQSLKDNTKQLTLETTEAKDSMTFLTDEVKRLEKELKGLAPSQATANLQTELQGQKKELADITELYKKKKEEQAKAEKTERDYSKTLADATAELKNYNEVQDESILSNVTGVTVIEKLDSATGGYIAKFPALNSGLKTAIGGMNGLKVAIASTGIGLLLIAFASLISYFKTSEEGQDKFAKYMGVIGSVVGNVSDQFSKLGKLMVWVFENPKQAINDLGNFIKDNIENRVVGLIEFIPQLGKAVNHVFKGEFKEAGEVATNALGKVALGQENIVGKFGEMINASKEWIKELEADAKEASRIADIRADATRLDRDLLIEQAKANRDIAELREKAVQKDIFSAKQREAFLIKASKIEDEIFEKQIRSAKLKEEAIKAENELSASNIDALNAEAEAEAKVIQLEADRLKSQRSLQREIFGARKEEALRLKTISDERKRIEKEANDLIISERQKQLDAILSIETTAIKAREDILAKTDQEKLDLDKERHVKALEEIILNEEEKRNAIIAVNELFDLKQKELDAIKQKEKEEADIEEKYKMLEDLRLTEEERLQVITDIDSMILESNSFTEKERTALYDKQTKARIKIAEKEAENKQKLNSAIAQGADALGSILGKQTAQGKILAVASSLINTYSSITGQLKAFSGIPIPGYAIMQAIATGAVGFASVKDILSVKVPNSGGADGGMAGSSISAPAVNLVGNSDSNQIAETINNQTDTQSENANKPFRAYVVTKDITTSEELERNANNSSSF